MQDGESRPQQRAGSRWEGERPRPQGMISISSVFDRFVALGERGSLEGKFLLAAELGLNSSEWLLAAGIAGAASLAIESDPARVRAANQRRIVEFTVSNLSEAVRILKNQIRKREPVIVCLAGDRSSALAEMLERGLQPDLLIENLDSVSATWPLRFLDRGACMVSGPRLPLAVPPAVTWWTREAPGLWLPRLDRILETMLSAKSNGSDFRLRWLGAAPAFLDPLLRSERFCRLSRKEVDAFATEVRLAVRAGEIGAAVSMEVEGTPPLVVEPHP